MMIFEKLGPATQRMLGSICKVLYGVWKKHFYKEEIQIHLDEFDVSSPEHMKSMLSWAAVHWDFIEYPYTGIYLMRRAISSMILKNGSARSTEGTLGPRIRTLTYHIGNIILVSSPMT
jgi:hypothetical protein